MIEEFAKQHAAKAANILKVDDPNFENAVIALYNFIPKTIALLIAGGVLGILWQLLILFAVYNLIRWQAMGIHLKSNLGCFLFGMFLYIGGTELAVHLTINWIGLSVMYVVLFITYFCFSPSGWETRPVTAGERKIKRNNSLLLLTIIFAAAYFLPHPFRELLIFACVAEAINLLPVTYKIFRERRFS